MHAIADIDLNIARSKQSELVIGRSGSQLRSPSSPSFSNMTKNDEAND